MITRDEARKFGREDCKAALAEDYRRRGKLPDTRAIDRKVNQIADRADKKKDKVGG